MENWKLQDILESFIASILLFLLIPLIFLLYILHKLFGKGSFIFKQLRTGKSRKSFWIYKIRTMIPEAEKQRAKLKKMNEADGPVFKIANDPRYTKLGRLIARAGLDEIPQLINIIKGEMSFVGPRPFPVSEAEKVSKRYQARFSVKPGITSLWVLEGAFHNDFKKWMELDVEYVKKKDLWLDVKIIILSSLMLTKLILRSLMSLLQDKDINKKDK